MRWIVLEGLVMIASAIYRRLKNRSDANGVSPPLAGIEAGASRASLPLVLTELWHGFQSIVRQYGAGLGALQIFVGMLGIAFVNFAYSMVASPLMVILIVLVASLELPNELAGPVFIALLLVICMPIVLLGVVDLLGSLVGLGYGVYGFFEPLRKEALGPSASLFSLLGILLNAVLFGIDAVVGIVFVGLLMSS